MILPRQQGYDEPYVLILCADSIAKTETAEGFPGNSIRYHVAWGPYGRGLVLRETPKMRGFKSLLGLSLYPSTVPTGSIFDRLPVRYLPP